MTETITIRLRRPKRELQAKAKPNVNAWVNQLIEQALDRTPTNWDEHFKRRKRHRAVAFTADEVREASR